MPAHGRTPIPRRAFALLCILSLSLMVARPPAATAQPAEGPDDVTIYDWFEEVSSLRSQGKYDDAIAVLGTIIENYAGTETVARRAYNDLVFTLLSKRDEAAAAARAREALTRFPDLAADPVYFPPSVNQVYDDLRAEMFGGILSVTKPGYKEESTPIRIQPAYQTNVPLSLEKERGKSWWLIRIGPAAVLTGVLVATQLGGDEPAAEGKATLPGPPPPPGE